ncbi:hypothetical protein SAMN05660690_4208 [Geodermatophilus telluris]|uniref:Cell wall-active antibiotics response 4TMS YvqF n=1 Tax=Geodermatophilus telluris TaxID=1190417 RepID=A0A1G6UHD8_9ACTN|nr:hypothetical protein [Geodermatophilus telluris]SDD40126.1 hypothetical protein SAMN05660690_4208 [Geodermatophilus telluris]
MRTTRRTPSRLRRALPWIGATLAVQGAVAVAGLVWSLRADEGDDRSAVVRRVRVMGGAQLRPRNPALSRVGLDVVMAGGEVDLTGLAPVPGGVDVTVRAVMGGAAVRVPPGWRVWSGTRAVAGGVGLAPGVRRTDDPRDADLRLHGWAVMGGVGVETPS